MAERNRPAQPHPVVRWRVDRASALPFSALTWTGELLIVQLLFVVASLPIVTVLPAAMALQRSLRDLLAWESGRPAATFLSHLTWSLRRFWLLGVLLAVGLAIAAGAFLFWISLSNGVRWLGVGVLGGLGYATLIGWVALLAASVSPRIVGHEADRTAVLEVAVDLLRRRAPYLCVAAVLIIGWLLALLQLPTVALVGSGLAPAAIVWFVVARREMPRAGRSRAVNWSRGPAGRSGGVR